MLKSGWKATPDVERHRAAGIMTIFVLGMAAILGFTSRPAVAVEVTTLYTVQVALNQKADDPRTAAYKDALSKVLLRVSGSELSADPGTVELLFPNPGSYVVQFRPGSTDTLWVSFDGRAIENTLRQAGQTVWGSDRPLTLVWLAVDWGQGRRQVIAADDPERRRAAARSIDRNGLLRQRLLDIAERRGLPVVFPLLDTEDLQNVSFSDIWGGFDEQLLEASKRYEANSILVGRIRPASSQRNTWSYYFSGAERDWTGELEQVVNQVADLLAAEFAVSGGAPLETIELFVAGINSVAAYGTVQKLLANLALIESYSITEVYGDQIHFRVEAHGGAERLRRALRFGGLIEQNGFDGDRLPTTTLNSSLEFFYSPQ